MTCDIIRIYKTTLYFSQNASFEVILITDGLYTYGVFIYDLGSWTMKNPFGSRKYTVGYSLEDKTGEIYATAQNYSNLNNISNVPNGKYIIFLFSNQKPYSDVLPQN